MSEPEAERLAVELAAMDRRQLIRTLREVRCDFELDFTDEYLRSVSIERLRHIVLAAALHDRRKSWNRG